MRRLHLAARKLVALVALMATFVATTTARAEPQNKPTPSANARDPAMTEARARFDEGVKLAEANDHEGARLKFNQAWALLKSPGILFNLARAEQLSNHPVDALDHYRQFAKLPPDPKITDAQRQRAAESITELVAKVGQIEIEAPAGARLSVDSKAIEPGNTDPIAVAPGGHVVEAIVDGKVRSVTVECAAGTVVKAKLIEPPSSPPPRPRPTPDTTAPPKDQGPGFWTTGRAAGLGVFVGGIAALGVGVVFHLGASDSEEQAKSLRADLPEPRASACSAPTSLAQCPKLSAAVDDQTSNENLRTAFFIGGGALVIGGAVLFLVSSPSSDRSPTRGGLRVLPLATARETGIAVVGRF
jgi:hypothetical protein